MWIGNWCGRKGLATRDGRGVAGVGTTHVGLRELNHWRGSATRDITTCSKDAGGVTWRFACRDTTVPWIRHAAHWSHCCPGAARGGWRTGRPRSWPGDVLGQKGRLRSWSGCANICRYRLRPRTVAVMVLVQGDPRPRRSVGYGAATGGRMKCVPANGRTSWRPDCPWPSRGATQGPGGGNRKEIRGRPAIRTQPTPTGP